MITARMLNHINLNVSDIRRSARFYQEALGLEIGFWEGKSMVFLHSPGAHDTITPLPGRCGRTDRWQRSVAFRIFNRRR